MTRIAVGGFLHETNTFAPTKATYADFVHGGGWPSMAQGADVLKVMRKINIGLAGFVEAADTNGWELIPTISCGASPSAHVTEDAYERIVKVMIDGIAAAGKLDAVYLDLHGAMVTEHLDDGEGEILTRVRKVIGKELPLSSVSTCMPMSRRKWSSMRMRLSPTAPTPMSTWPTPAAPPQDIWRSC